MTTIAEAVREFVDELLAAGIRATSNPADLNPPAVLVRAPTVEYRFGDASWDGAFTALAVVPETSGHTAALDALSQLVDDVRAAIRVRGARPVDVTLPDGAIVPGFELTWSTRIY